ncbi:MAG: hypothetical protein VCC00_14940 [Deltaproteobacteria bacterium]
MLQKILISGVALLVVVGGAVFYLASSLDGIVENIIETKGSAATGTAVRVSGVHISLRDARASIDRLTVANPDGFPGDLISFGSITVSIDPASLVAREPIVLTEVRVDDPQVNLVVGTGGRTNLQALQQKLKRSGSGSGSGSGGGGGGSDDSGGAVAKSTRTPIRIRIDRLEIGQAALSADLAAVGGKNYETKIAAVQRRNLGGAAGASPGRIAEIIAQAIVQETASAVARSEAKNELGKLIDKNLKGGAAEAARGLLGGLLGK